MVTILRLLFVCSIVHRVKNDDCVGCETKFINDPMGCEYWASLRKDGCTGWSNEQTVTDRTNNDPIMHTPIGNHCVFMAAYSIAENKGKLNVWKNIINKKRAKKWGKLLWNRRARDIDNIFNKKNVKSTWYPLKNWKAMSRPFNRFKPASFGGGEFHPFLEQLMFENIGLNFAPNEPHERKKYPDYWTRTFQADFKFKRGDKWHGQPKDVNWYKQVINEVPMFKNRKYNTGQQLVPMVGIIIGVNSAPFQNKYNHDTAFLKHTNGHFYYLDSNVEAIRTLLPENKNPPMTNLYKDNPIPFDVTNPTPVFKDGYLVDWSLDLGNNVDIAAQWLYDKCEVRPRQLDKSNIPNMDVADSGGALWFRIVVEDNSRTWSDLLDVYKQQTTELTTEQLKDKAGQIRNFIGGLNYAKADVSSDWLRYESEDEDKEKETAEQRFMFINEGPRHQMVDMATDNDMYYLMFIGLGICFEGLIVFCCLSIAGFFFSVYFGYKYFGDIKK